MSTADVTHVQQGFRVPIPHVDEEARVEVPVVTLCERHLKYGKPFKKVCGNVQKARDWSRATVESLTLIQKAVINQALDSLPGDDDRQWIRGDKLSAKADEERLSSTHRHEGDHQERSKCEELELRYVHYQ